MTSTTAITNRAIPLAPASRPYHMVGSLILTDIFSLLLSVAIGIGCKLALHRSVGLEGYLQMWPFLFVFIVVYGAVGLYSGVALSPPEELRRVTVSSTLVFLFLAAGTVSMRGARSYFTWVLFLAIALSVALVPVLRACVRSLFANESWWGYPAVVFGAGKTAQLAVQAMLREPGLGLKPVAVVDNSREAPARIHGVPVLACHELASEMGQARMGQSRRRGYAVLAMPGIPHADALALVERCGFDFSHILVIPDLIGISSLWVSPKSVGGMLGLEVSQQVMAYKRRIPKRIMDLFFTVAGGFVLLPVAGLIALWIKLDSRGPLLYGQSRVGQGGKEFTAWKFRSMKRDAEALLQQHLESDPALRAEWERDRKLKNDPRVTRAGRFLRRTSLDELPQLWNVLTGDMSLVGPRPIVEDEIPRYGSSFSLYSKVKGGVTGLWQVSGRNDTSYDERVEFDTFYVRNWSVWLDLCILFRTIGTVLLRKGAY
ncbi:MAG: undecaprenyl-phosphate galactose phosphotransferase WbaP [Acidobacteriota bacterium]|nr:undecaprenyl-phosphate galactose phosphotransferase WbaP [Acidobacteriota bacterium]